MGEPIALEGDLHPGLLSAVRVRQAQGRLFGTEFEMTFSTHALNGLRKKGWFRRR
jgi:hypothetical protein